MTRKRLANSLEFASTRPPRRHPRDAFTLMELIVVLAIIGVLIGILVPAVQKVRESANRIYCANNLKQIGLAFHDCAAIHDQLLPPGIGSFPREDNHTYGTALFHILPYLEQDNLFNQSADDKGTYRAENHNVYSTVIKAFLCPSDPTVGDGTGRDSSGLTWGKSSYAANAQVFAEVFGLEEYGPYYQWYLKNASGHPSLLYTFEHGTSSTILFAEKYTWCTNYARAAGGSFWAYDLTDGPVEPLHAGYAISWYHYDVGPRELFRVRPALTDCDPTLASTAHASGIQVCMADGHVQTIKPSVSLTTWWALCTPADWQLPGDDY